MLLGDICELGTLKLWTVFSCVNGVIGDMGDCALDDTDLNILLEVPVLNWYRLNESVVNDFP